MQCPFCNNEIAEHVKFCVKCGRQIPRCPTCNRVIRQRIKYCKYDGTLLSEEIFQDFPEEMIPDFPENIDVESDSPRFPKGLMIGCSTILLLLITGIGFLLFHFFTDSFSFTKNNDLQTEEVQIEETTESSTDGNVISFVDEQEADSAVDETTELSTESSTEKEESDTEIIVEMTEASTETLTETLTETSADSVLDQAKIYEQSAVSYESHAYAIFNLSEEKLSSYNECEFFCENMGGHLAVINSEEENDFLYKYVKDSGLKLAFFGYTDQGSEGYWKWVDGSDNGYTNWNPGQPNNGSNTANGAAENYAEFYKGSADGTWNDAVFGKNTYYFICEWE